MRNQNHMVKRAVKVLNNGEIWECTELFTKAQAMDAIDSAMESWSEDITNYIWTTDGFFCDHDENFDETFKASMKRNVVAWEQQHSEGTCVWVSNRASQDVIDVIGYTAELTFETCVENDDEVMIKRGDEIIEHFVPEIEEEVVEASEKIVVIEKDAEVMEMPVESTDTNIRDIAVELLNNGHNDLRFLKVTDDGRTLLHAYSMVQSRIRHTYAASWYDE